MRVFLFNELIIRKQKEKRIYMREKKNTKKYMLC
jgi:hypothetical protein